MVRCPFYVEDVYDGRVAQINCVNPDIYQEDGSYKCPYGKEYDCNIPIHKQNRRYEK